MNVTGIVNHSNPIACPVTFVGSATAMKRLQNPSSILMMEAIKYKGTNENHHCTMVLSLVLLVNQAQQGQKYYIKNQYIRVFLDLET
jgi:hypothetical protein